MGHRGPYLSTCYNGVAELTHQVAQFELQINANPESVVNRLRVTTRLKPEEEKLRVSD